MDDVVQSDLTVARSLTILTLRALVEHFGISPSMAGKMVRNNHVFTDLLNKHITNKDPQDIARLLLENSFN